MRLLLTVLAILASGCNGGSMIGDDANSNNGTREFRLGSKGFSLDAAPEFATSLDPLGGSDEPIDMEPAPLEDDRIQQFDALLFCVSSVVVSDVFGNRSSFSVDPRIFRFSEQDEFFGSFGVTLSAFSSIKLGLSPECGAIGWSALLNLRQITLDGEAEDPTALYEPASIEFGGGYTVSQHSTALLDADRLTLALLRDWSGTSESFFSIQDEVGVLSFLSF